MARGQGGLRVSVGFGRVRLGRIGERVGPLQQRQRIHWIWPAGSVRDNRRTSVPALSTRVSLHEEGVPPARDCTSNLTSQYRSIRIKIQSSQYVNQ